MSKSGIDLKDDLADVSFAAPNDDDIAAFNALSDDDKRALIDAQITTGIASATSRHSMHEIWLEALKRANPEPTR